jgi:FixJ family two-component response regulator
MTVAAPFIAVVDDEAPVRKALGRLLRLADWDAVAFESGEAFLDSLATQRPDCVVLDVNMPGLTGLEVVRRLRAAHLAVPVVLITASDDADMLRHALEAGAATLLRKPFSGDTLLAAISKAIGREPLA